MGNATGTAIRDTLRKPDAGKPVIALPDRFDIDGPGVLTKSGWQYAFDAIFLAVVCGCMFFYKLGTVGLFDGAGAGYAESAREMVETGNYVLPQLNFQIVFAKPILSYWLISAAYHVFGVNEFAAHFWSATAATLLVASTYIVVRHLAGRNAGLFASLILATAPLMVLFGRLSCLDVVFCATLGFALSALVIGVFLGRKIWLIPGYAALGLSVLANGPIGLSMFVVTGGIYLLCARHKKAQVRELLKDAHLEWGLPILAIVCVPWFAFASVVTNGLWTKMFFAPESWCNFASSTNYVRAFSAIGWGFAPWILFMPNALKLAFSNHAEHLDQPQRRGLLFFASFVVAVMLLLPFAQSQTSGYILALLAPSSVLIGVLLSQWASRTSVHFTPAVWRNFCLFLAVVAPLGALAGGVAIHFLFKNVPAMITGFGLAGCVAFWVGMTLQYGLLRSERVGGCVATVVYTFVVCTALFVPVAFNIGYSCLQQDLYALTTEVKQRGGQVVLYKSFAPSVMFYLERPVDCVFDSQLMSKDELTKQPTYVLARAKAADNLRSLFPGQIHQLDQRGDWRLLLASHIHVARPAQSSTMPAMRTFDNQIISPFCAGTAPAQTKFHRWM